MRKFLDNGGKVIDGNDATTPTPDPKPTDPAIAPPPSTGPPSPSPSSSPDPPANVSFDNLIGVTDKGIINGRVHYQCAFQASSPSANTNGKNCHRWLHCDDAVLKSAEAKICVQTWNQARKPPRRGPKLKVVTVTDAEFAAGVIVDSA